MAPPDPSDIDPLDIAQAFKLPPRQAIDFFRAKGHKIDWNWWESWEAAHSKSFTVAKAMRMDVLTDIRSQMNKALKQGLTAKDFARTLEPRLKKLGWWGRQVIVDSQGRAEVVQLGSPHRLKTIYRTNMNTARAQAHYKNAKANAEDRPYWQYDALQDGRTRPHHAAMDGLVFRHDDPFWDSHYPPNGFNCRCRVRAFTEDDLKERDLKVTSGNEHLRQVDQQVGVDKRTGEVIKRPATEFRQGDRVMTPDPGWNYNPGATATRDLQAVEIRKMERNLTQGEGGMVNQSISQGLSSQPFHRFINKTKAADGEVYPVAAVSAQRAKYMGLPEQVDARVLRLSSESVDHLDHQKRFARLKNKDWQRIQRMIDQGELMPDRLKTHRILLLKDAEQSWTLVFKYTRNNELYLTTYHRANARQVRNMEKRKKQKDNGE